LDEVPREVLEKLKVHFVETVDGVLELALLGQPPKARGPAPRSGAKERRAATRT